jgi:hypothetical protein
MMALAVPRRTVMHVMKAVRMMFGVDVIDSRFLAYMLVFSIASGVGLRAWRYVDLYPGWFGWLLFALSPLTAVVAAVTILYAVRARQRADFIRRSPRSRLTTLRYLDAISEGEELGEEDSRAIERVRTLIGRAR